MKTSFILKHCLTTILLSPFIYDLIANYVFNSDILITDATIYFIIIIYSLLFSIPTHILYIILFYILKKNKLNIKHLKTILILFYSVGILITFYFSFGLKENSITIAYIFTSIFSGSIYKLNK